VIGLQVGGVSLSLMSLGTSADLLSGGRVLGRFLRSAADWLGMKLKLFRKLTVAREWRLGDLAGSESN
jgi:hypothetical protein